MSRTPADGSLPDASAPDDSHVPGLRDGEPLGTGLRRIAAAELEAAVASLRGDDVHAGVHDARKRLKRVRAVLRMVRDDIPHDRFRSENVFFRDCGRELAEVRDAKVRVETLDSLLEHASPWIRRDAYENLRARLVERFEATSRRHIVEERWHLRVAAALEGSVARIELWPVGEDRFETIGPGIRRVYRRGLSRGKQAFGEPTFERFHEWRKRVKYLSTQLLVLEALVPRLTHRLNEALGQISDLIGDSTDLAELARLLEDEPSLLDDPRRTTLLELIDARRAELRALSHPLGREVWRYAPDEFVERLAAYWDAWRREHPVHGGDPVARTDAPDRAGDPAADRREIERKFLVLGDPRGPSVEIRQGYLSAGEPEVRVRLAKGEATLTVKADAQVGGDGAPLRRTEIEVPLSAETGEALLALCPQRIEKTRYLNGRWEIDLFPGPRPVLIAEVELSAPDEPLPDPPAWLRIVREVTHDEAYRNRALAAGTPGERANGGAPGDGPTGPRPVSPLDVLERVLLDVERALFGR